MEKSLASQPQMGELVVKIQTRRNGAKLNDKTLSLPQCKDSELKTDFRV